MKKRECGHKQTYELKKKRKNYPFGRKSKVRFGGVIKTTKKCCKCKEILGR